MLKLAHKITGNMFQNTPAALPTIMTQPPLLIFGAKAAMAEIMLDSSWSKGSRMSRQTKAAPELNLSTFGSKGASWTTTHSDLAFSAVSVSVVLTVQLPGPIHEAFRLAHSRVLAESLCKCFVAGSVKGTTVVSSSVSVSNKLICYVFWNFNLFVGICWFQFHANI